MAEILLPDCQFPRLSDGATCRDIQPEALCQACTAHVQVAALRTRLESAEKERDAARTALRACYEYIERTIPMMGVPDAIQRRADVLNDTRDALGAAGEENANG